MVPIVANEGTKEMSTVRYIVDDVADAVDFYVSKLGFEVEQ